MRNANYVLIYSSIHPILYSRSFFKLRDFYFSKKQIFLLHSKVIANANLKVQLISCFSLTRALEFALNYSVQGRVVLFSRKMERLVSSGGQSFNFRMALGRHLGLLLLRTAEHMTRLWPRMRYHPPWDDRLGRMKGTKQSYPTRPIWDLQATLFHKTNQKQDNNNGAGMLYILI